MHFRWKVVKCSIYHIVIEACQNVMDWKNRQKKDTEITCNTSYSYVSLFYLRSCWIVTAKLSRQICITCHTPHHTLKQHTDNPGTLTLEKDCKGPTAGVIERSGRQISLPWLQEFTINTFPPGTFSILSIVRLRGFESSTELWQIKAVETGSLRVKDINPITF